MPGTIRTVAIALVLVLGALSTATPSAAQGFRFFTDDDDRRLPFSDLICANEYQVRQLIARKGYSDIFLNARQGRSIQARATKGSWVYLIRFDRCSKTIVDVERLRRAS